MRNVTYINAGAGSGKTYTLTKILAEKLSERDENGNPVIMPSQVILTTFTDLAASYHMLLHLGFLQFTQYFLRTFLCADPLY